MVDLIQHIGTEIFGRAIEDYSSSGQCNDSVGVSFCELDLVQAYDGGNGVLFAYEMEQREYVVCRSWIEARYRLIGKDDFRLLRDGPCYSDPLLLPPAEAIDPAEGFVQEPYPFEALHGQPLFVLGQRKQASKSSMESDPSHQHILESTVASDKLVLLEDHGRAFTVLSNDSSASQFAQPLNFDGARTGCVQVIEAPEQR